MKYVFYFKVYKFINLIHSKCEKFFSRRIGLCPICKGGGSGYTLQGVYTCDNCGGDGLIWSEGEYYASELHDMYDEYEE